MMILFGFQMPGGYLRNVICFYGPVARCDDDTNPFSYGEPASNCTAGTGPTNSLCGFHATTTNSSTSTTSTTTTTTSSTTPTTTIPTTTTPITTSSTTTTTEPTTTTTMEFSIDCKSLGRCTQTYSTTTITTPTPIVISSPSPCNSSSLQIPATPINNAASEILMKVFYYICHLLSISPSAATASLVNSTSILL